jgi:DNA replication protein DnaC
MNQAMSNEVPVMSIPNKVEILRLMEIEKTYTFEGWKNLNLSWKDRGTQLVKEFSEGVHRSAWLWSHSPGTGKTGLAVCMALNYKETARWDAIVLRMGRVASMRTEERSSLLRDVKRCGLVIFDDLHLFSVEKEWNIAWLHSLVDLLYGENIRVIVTSNLSPEEFHKSGGQAVTAVVDRLFQGGLAIVETTGGSVRE